jgi:hypothetical protein
MAETKFMPFKILALKSPTRINSLQLPSTALKYLELTMTVNPQNVFAAPLHMPTATSRNIYLRVPQTAAGVMHNTITMPMLNNVTALLLHMNTNGLAIEFSCRVDDAPDTATFEAWIEEIYEKARFETMAHLLQAHYVGEAVIQSPAERLHALRQKIRMTTTPTFKPSLNTTAVFRVWLQNYRNKSPTISTCLSSFMLP